MLCIAMLFVLFETSSCLYRNFFTYGDRDYNDILDDRDEEMVMNLSWLSEYYRWKMALKKVPTNPSLVDPKGEFGETVVFKDLKMFFETSGNIEILNSN